MKDGIDKVVDKLLEMSDEIKSLNVNIGIDKGRRDYEELAAKIEAEVDKLGGEFNNEGSSGDTYNINANFAEDQMDIGYEFADRIKAQGHYVETESFPLQLYNHHRFQNEPS